MMIRRNTMMMMISMVMMAMGIDDADDGDGAVENEEGKGKAINQLRTYCECFKEIVFSLSHFSLFFLNSRGCCL